MTLINEQWYRYDMQAKQLVLATQEQIDEHFSRKPADNNWWTGDFS